MAQDSRSLARFPYEVFPSVLLLVAAIWLVVDAGALVMRPELLAETVGAIFAKFVIALITLLVSLRWIKTRRLSWTHAIAGLPTIVFFPHALIVAGVKFSPPVISLGVTAIVMFSLSCLILRWAYRDGLIFTVIYLVLESGAWLAIRMLLSGEAFRLYL